jgi:hypothetical protein
VRPLSDLFSDPKADVGSASNYIASSSLIRELLQIRLSFGSIWCVALLSEYSGTRKESLEHDGTSTGDDATRFEQKLCGQVAVQLRTEQQLE